MSQDPRKLCAAVLIGGRGRRMGRSKHDLLLSDGQCFAGHVVDALREVVDEVVLVGPGDLPSSLNTLIRLDDTEADRGPMAGILAVLRYHPSSAWLVTPCDMPLLEPEILSLLIQGRNPARLATAFRFEHSPRPEPFPCIYEPACRELFEQAMKSHASVLRTLNDEDFQQLPTPPLWSLFDCDTKEDLVLLDHAFQGPAPKKKSRSGPRHG